MRKSTRYFGVLLGIMLASLVLLGATGCSSDDPDEGTAGTDSAATVNLVLASTTSTQDSGLFDVLIPAFEDANPGIKTQVVAVGTGEAIQKGRDGDADVLLVHSKADEEKLVADGIGVSRKDVMYNDFVIVGPADDPAKVAGSKDAAEAFKNIMDSKSSFISRGDDSGTHKKELKIWEAAGLTPEGDWYKSAGQGMGDTLKMTDELGAYTIADRATYLTMTNEGAIESKIVFEGAADLLNQYGVIVIKDAREFDAATKFSDWITSAEGQAVIAKFGVDTFGQALFTPNYK